MPFHNQRARSASFNRESGGIRCGKRCSRKFDGRTGLCHTVMTLRSVSAALQPTLRRLAGATRTRTCLDSSSINTMTQRPAIGHLVDAFDTGCRAATTFPSVTSSIIIGSVSELPQEVKKSKKRTKTWGCVFIKEVLIWTVS